LAKDFSEADLLGKAGTSGLLYTAVPQNLYLEIFLGKWWSCILKKILSF